ncbi:MAG: hypothetical protein QOC81_1581 [Thermoanaerobaculia bacterium]|jgi:hypothetical protein|nr:hypothetical protein [Thermoanaerobaculia bacterium]
MTRRRTTVFAALLIVCTSLLRCTGGQESSAAEEQAPRKNGLTASSPEASASSQPPQVDAKATLRSISGAIPIYAGAKYRDDLTRRDSVMIKNQYGPNAEVYTLATDDSFPQVYHYYTTYLAQFRAYPSQAPYPATQTWRTLEIQLNQAMQDPFIPGDMLKPGDRQVTLQIAETEAEPKTVIRYVITPQPVQAAQVQPAQAQTPKPASTNAFDRE